MALDQRSFWTLAPREFAALQKEWLNHRRHLDMRFAEMQLTMHRAWWKGDFKLEQFLPAVEPAKPKYNDWRTQKMVLGAIFEGIKKQRRLADGRQ